MRDKVIFERYLADREYRYKIYRRQEDLYEVWVQKKITDDYMGAEWHGYHDIRDCMHITDSLQRAVEIGDELLK